MSLFASTLPSNDGYVAAAYIVFFVLLLVYLTIMGIRLTRMERRLRELQERREEAAAQRGAGTSPDPGRSGEAASEPSDGPTDTREREAV
jgi:hypothetical protein